MPYGHAWKDRYNLIKLVAYEDNTNVKICVIFSTFLKQYGITQKLEPIRKTNVIFGFRDIKIPWIRWNVLTTKMCVDQWLSSVKKVVLYIACNSEHGLTEFEEQEQLGKMIMKES